MTMAEIRAVTGVTTVAAFESVASELSDDGWNFVATLNTDDAGQVLVFSREQIGLGRVRESPN
jgi:hypothetical protein